MRGVGEGGMGGILRGCWRGTLVEDRHHRFRRLPRDALKMVFHSPFFTTAVLKQKQVTPFHNVISSILGRSSGVLLDYH